MNFGKSFGKGAGKGKKGNTIQLTKENTVWLNGIPAGVTNDTLMELGKQAGNCKKALVVKNGVGYLEFGSPEEVGVAVSLLNGATTEDATLEADYWQKPAGQS